MSHDLTDRVIGSWVAARPELDVDALQVTARLSRIGPLLAKCLRKLSSTNSGLAVAKWAP